MRKLVMETEPLYVRVGSGLQLHLVSTTINTTLCGRYFGYEAHVWNNKEANDLILYRYMDGVCESCRKASVQNV